MEPCGAGIHSLNRFRMKHDHGIDISTAVNPLGLAGGVSASGSFCRVVQAENGLGIGDAGG